MPLHEIPCSRGQNTTEYLLMLAAIVGGVLVMGTLLKTFMPSLFSQVAQAISGVCNTVVVSGASPTEGVSQDDSGNSSQDSSASSSGITVGDSPASDASAGATEEHASPSWEGGGSKPNPCPVLRQGGHDGC